MLHVRTHKHTFTLGNNSLPWLSKTLRKHKGSFFLLQMVCFIPHFLLSPLHPHHFFFWHISHFCPCHTSLSLNTDFISFNFLILVIHLSFLSHHLFSAAFLFPKLQWALHVFETCIQAKRRWCKISILKINGRP